MIRQKDKILNIVNDYLIKNNTIVSVSIEYTDRTDCKACMDSSQKDKFKYIIGYNPELWESKLKKPKYDNFDYARDIVSTMLHEATHIISHHRNLNSTDGDYGFEKLLYDNYLNSNYKVMKGAEILGISEEEYQKYLDERPDNFYTNYINYINYLIGFTNEISNTI